jgi:hypothetical protein
MGDGPGAGVDHELVGADPRVGPLNLAIFPWHRRAGRDAGPYDTDRPAGMAWITDHVENVFVSRITITAARAPIS